MKIAKSAMKITKLFPNSTSLDNLEHDNLITWHMFNFNEKLTLSICSKKWSCGATFNDIIALFGDAAENSQFQAKQLHMASAQCKCLLKEFEI